MSVVELHTPPLSLSALERAEWHALAPEPGSWWTPARRAALTEFCRASVQASQIADAMAGEDRDERGSLWDEQIQIADAMEAARERLELPETMPGGPPYPPSIARGVPARGLSLAIQQGKKSDG